MSDSYSRGKDKKGTCSIILMEIGSVQWCRVGLAMTGPENVSQTRDYYYYYRSSSCLYSFIAQKWGTAMRLFLLLLHISESAFV